MASINNEFNEMGYSDLLAKAWEANCNDGVFSVLLNRYGVDAYWAEKISQHPNASLNTKMKLISDGYHLKSPGVAEALMSSINDVGVLSNIQHQLKVAYSDHARHPESLGLKSSQIDDYPILKSLVGPLINPDYRLVPRASDAMSKISSAEVTRLVQDFHSAYKELPESPSIKPFVSSMLRNTNELTDQAFYQLYELSSNVNILDEGRGRNNFLSSESDVINLMQQEMLSDKLKSKALVASSDYIYRNQSLIKNAFESVPIDIFNTLREIGVQMQYIGRRVKESAMEIPTAAKLMSDACKKNQDLSAEQTSSLVKRPRM
ncbi:hypothetical protein [Aeromonas hydrophila]|uniref:hypothetical protein n=1 Tax=Aeromonas hydrophila TaxID=644 RepID=UPI002B4627C9|nr:hypothetical protein [Aeromonas hydrophila]